MGLASIAAVPNSCKGVFEYEAQNWGVTGYRSICAVMGIRHGFLPHSLITKDGPGQYHWIAEAHIEQSVNIITEILSGEVSDATRSILYRYTPTL
jgi:hypothetical protein